MNNKSRLGASVPFYLGMISYLSIGCAHLIHADDSRPKQPNIVLILTDDLGWQDVKCYDLDDPSPMETPNIDGLASRGVKFWQAYSPAPTCAPTRCAIMSGNHPARAQKTHVVGGHPPTPYVKKSWKMMAPWYSGRMPENERTLAKVLQQNGYVTGHSGKWHMAIHHHSFPQPEDQGFSWTRSELGITRKMKPDRLSEFATSKKGDKFQLDENGFPYHENSANALQFMAENKDKPFFLYYATWLVHTPIHTRNERLLDKYCKKLGVNKSSLKVDSWDGAGQTNPFYCAMVEELDYHVGKVFDYLENTEDPRWAGHKLSENTYVIFTSGGVRVPLIITGPNIPAAKESDAMVNGLDFFPTILALTGVRAPEGKSFDGLDISNHLRSPADASLIKDADGEMRDMMMWHFPNSRALESTIRVGGYKLIRNYENFYEPKKPEFELYQLYKEVDGKQVRVDIEESKNLADELPRMVKSMDAELSNMLNEMKASYPYLNPHYQGDLEGKDRLCSVSEYKLEDHLLHLSYQENGAKVMRANLLYTLNGGHRYEEWFRMPAELEEGKVVVRLPKGTTHYVVNLIDENNFLVSYPEIPDKVTMMKNKDQYSSYALKGHAELPLNSKGKGKKKKIK